MSDLKSFWPNPVGPDEGLSGDSITSSGSDPSVTVDAPNGLTQVLWPNPPVKSFSGEESPNSVSGLPSLPNRFEPSEQPPGPPSLKDRSPGTIDKQ